MSGSDRHEFWRDCSHSRSPYLGSPPHVQLCEHDDDFVRRPESSRCARTSYRDHYVDKDLSPIKLIPSPGGIHCRSTTAVERSDTLSVHR